MIASTSLIWGELCFVVPTQFWAKSNGIIEVSGLQAGPSFNLFWKPKEEGSEHPRTSWKMDVRQTGFEPLTLLHVGRVWPTFFQHFLVEMWFFATEVVLFLFFMFWILGAIYCCFFVLHFVDAFFGGGEEEKLFCGPVLKAVESSIVPLFFCI